MLKIKNKKGNHGMNRRMKKIIRDRGNQIRNSSNAIKITKTYSDIEKIEHIESLLLQINDKIDNFMGFEDLSENEKERVKKLRAEVMSGEYLTLKLLNKNYKELKVGEKHANKLC